MSKLKKALKEKFDYDVTALPDYTKETMPDIITDVIGNSEFLEKLTLREGVKGSERINLLNGDITLQAKENCAQSPDGSFIFTDAILNVHQLYMGIEFCNEDLNGKVTEMLNAIGMKRQNGQLPAELDAIIMAYLLKSLRRKAQRVTILGDTTSIDAELALFDGLVKLINNDTTVVDYMSSEASITASNAYAIAYGLFKSIPVDLFDNEMEVEIYMGRDKALLVLEDWNNANPYSQVPVPDQKGSSMTFTLPLTNVTVMSLPELNGTNHMFAFPLNLAFLGTDATDDWSFDVKYDDYNDKLKAEASFRLGTQIVWGQYFTRLQLAVS
jgi:hypothetical protein